MPPRFAAFRSRTNSILDTITGAIPDAPPNATFKDRSLTCRRCGNRFRDVLELDRHFNLLPEHSDYGDSHDYESFVRAKVRRRSTRDQETPAAAAASPSGAFTTSPLASPLKSPSSFSDSQPQSPDKEQQDKPTFFRKLSTLTNTPLVATDSNEASPTEATPKNKGKGKARAFPQLRREDTGFTQINSDDGHSVVRDLPPRPSKSVEKPLPPSSWLEEEAVEVDSIKSDSSFRTASSNGVTTGKSRIAAQYADFDSKSSKRRDYQPSTDKESLKSVSSKGVRPGKAHQRHASEGDLLLSTPLHHPEAPPPSYHELHGTTDPFDTPGIGSSAISAPTSPLTTGPRPWLSSRTRAATSNGYDAPWITSNPPSSFPVTFSSYNLDDELSSNMANNSISKPRSHPRPWLSMNTTSPSQPSLFSSPPHSPTASPSTPRTPSNAFANFPLPSTPISPSRDRRTSRTRSESNPASTRCPTCFAKYSSLASVLKHLENSECGAVEFESGIV